jgi:protein TonB
MLRRVLLHNTAQMPLRLILAFALSLAVHGALLLPDIAKRFPVAAPRPPLEAVLRPPPGAPTPPAGPLLKNTIDTEEAPQVAKPPPQATPQPKRRNAMNRDVQIAQRKLSKTQFYPPEANLRGIEGEVRLIVRLSADGRIDDVSVAASSGHAILDNAAIKAAYAMGQLSGVTSRELILPVIFRLQ